MHRSADTNRSHVLSSELNRLYDRLGGIIGQLTHQDNPHNIKLSLDLPSYHHPLQYHINLKDHRRDQCCHDHCYHSRGCCYPRDEKIGIEEPKVQAPIRYKYSVVDTSAPVHHVQQVRERPFVASQVKMPQPTSVTIHEKLIQTERIEDSRPPVLTESIDIQTDAIPQPVRPPSPKPIEIQRYPPTHIRQMTYSSHDMISDLNRDLHRHEEEKDACDRRRKELQMRLRANLERVNHLCHSTKKTKKEDNRKCIFQGCRCKGMFQEQIRRTLTPTFNTYRYSPKKYDYQPHISYERRLNQEKKKSDISASHLNKYVYNIKNKYVTRTPAKEEKEQASTASRSGVSHRQTKSVSPGNVSAVKKVSPIKNRHIDSCLNLAAVYRR